MSEEICKFDKGNKKILGLDTKRTSCYNHAVTGDIEMKNESELWLTPRQENQAASISAARYQWRKFVWFLQDCHSEIIFTLLLAVLMVVLYKALRAETAAKVAHEAAWMTECQHDRKHYECEAMWRAGEDHEHFIPLVIPMAVGR